MTFFTRIEKKNRKKVEVTNNMDQDKWNWFEARKNHLLFIHSKGH